MVGKNELVIEDTKELEENILDDETDTDDNTPPGDDPDSDDFGDSNLFNDSLGYDDFGAQEQSPMDKHSNLLKNLTDFAPYLKDSVNGWLGLTWNAEHEKYETNPEITPIMNEAGAAWSISFLKTYARSNNIITNIGKEEYKYIMYDIIDTIWLNLGTRPELGVLNDGDLIRVCTELEHAAALILMGAGDGKYNQFLGSTYHHTTTGNVNGAPMGMPGMYPSMGMGMPGMGGLPKKKVGMVGKFRNFLLGNNTVKYN